MGAWPPRGAGDGLATSRHTAEEISRMPVDLLERLVDPALLQRVPASRIARMSPEEIRCIIKVKRDCALSLDYSPEQLAMMPENELARVVPRSYLERYGSHMLAAMTPDELAHTIPTDVWLHLTAKGRVDVRSKLVLMAPGGGDPAGMHPAEGDPADMHPAEGDPAGNLYRDPVEYRARFGVAAGPWVVVVAPHPDDETYGVAGITHDLYRCGWNVAQVLCTHGEAALYYWAGYPALWNSREQFGSFRVAEWRHATFRISPASLRFCYDCGDRDLSISEAVAIVEYVNEYVGGASLVLATAGLPWECHPDHQALAEGLRRSAVRDELKRWYYVYADWPFLAPHTLSHPLTHPARAAKNAALQEYKDNSPYAIGHNTTPLVWRRAYDDDCEYYSYLPGSA